MTGVEHIPGYTCHARKGSVENAFRYSVDFILLDAERASAGPRLFSRNTTNILSVRDRDHGGNSGNGRGAAWAREVLAAHKINASGPLKLLTQGRVLGHVFNPVSFWLAHDGSDRLIAVIAEVTNTFGDRHSYLCVKPDRSEISGSDKLRARKALHVSPFQPVEGGYVFRFDIRAERIGIQIDFSRRDGGVVATLCGPRRDLTDRGIVMALLRRPFGSRRVMALIHWQALRLWWKGALYRRRPAPPKTEKSQ